MRRAKTLTAASYYLLAISYSLSLLLSLSADWLATPFSAVYTPPVGTATLTATGAVTHAAAALTGQRLYLTATAGAILPAPTATAQTVALAATGAVTRVFHPVTGACVYATATVTDILPATSPAAQTSVYTCLTNHPTLTRTNCNAALMLVRSLTATVLPPTRQNAVTVGYHTLADTNRVTILGALTNGQTLTVSATLTNHVITLTRGPGVTNLPAVTATWYVADPTNNLLSLASAPAASPGTLTALGTPGNGTTALTSGWLPTNTILVLTRPAAVTNLPTLSIVRHVQPATTNTATLAIVSADDSATNTLAALTDGQTASLSAEWAETTDTLMLTLSAGVTNLPSVTLGHYPSPVTTNLAVLSAADAWKLHGLSALADPQPAAETNGLALTATYAAAPSAYALATLTNAASYAPSAPLWLFSADVLAVTATRVTNAVPLRGILERQLPRY